MKQRINIEIEWFEIFANTQHEWPEDGIDTYLVYSDATTIGGLKKEMVPGYSSVQDYLDQFIFGNESINRVFYCQPDVNEQLPLPECFKEI
jgi:hypothetical protein